MRPARWRRSEPGGGIGKNGGNRDRGGGLAACSDDVAGPSDSAAPVRYLGVETQLLDHDLVLFQVRMSGTGVTREDVSRYGECAAAQYALIRGFGFARHVRTGVEKRGKVWHGDAGYVISAALPEGLRTIDAEVVVQDCISQGIPTV